MSQEAVFQLRRGEFLPGAFLNRFCAMYLIDVKLANAANQHKSDSRVIAGMAGSVIQESRISTIAKERAKRSFAWQRSASRRKMLANFRNGSTYCYRSRSDR